MVYSCPDNESFIIVDMLTYDQVQALPKIDLHRHLEGSLRLKSLVDIAKEYDLDVPKDIEVLRPYVQVTSEPPNAFTFLAKFEMLRNFYRTPEAIKRLVYEAVEDAALDNVKYLELRFSPQALSRVRGYALSSVTDWTIEAVNQASKDHDIDVKLIITLVRHNSVEQAKKVARLAYDRQDQGIVGLDLAGDEINCPADPFIPIFQEARQRGLGITVHAGEWMGADTVRQAINELGAHRIGHGTRTVEDPAVMELSRRNNISMEICLTSNVQTASVKHLQQHPLQKFIKSGISTTLNTDDPSISNITLTHEFNEAINKFQLNYANLRDLAFSAIEAAFLTPSEKEALHNRFLAFLPTEAPEVFQTEDTFFSSFNLT